jgi:hypothetical protein
VMRILQFTLSHADLLLFSLAAAIKSMRRGP